MSRRKNRGPDSEPSAPESGDTPDVEEVIAAPAAGAPDSEPSAPAAPGRRWTARGQRWVRPLKTSLYKGIARFAGGAEFQMSIEDVDAQVARGHVEKVED